MYCELDKEIFARLYLSPAERKLNTVTASLFLIYFSIHRVYCFKLIYFFV